MSAVIDYFLDIFESYMLGRAMKSAEDEESIPLEEAARWLKI